MYDYRRLLGKMKEQGVTQAELAQTLGIAESSLNKKLRNCSQFKQGEMLKIMEHLSIPLSELPSFFYAH